jgi:hypothetical protein
MEKDSKSPSLRRTSSPSLMPRSPFPRSKPSPRLTPRTPSPNSKPSPKLTPRTPPRKLTRKESGRKIQLHGDCWLYASSTLTANHLLRFDTEEIIEFPNYKRLFEGYTSEHGFPHECEEELSFENFRSFVNRENLIKITRIYLTNELCHAEIYYNFLFYFVYFIGMKTRTNINGYSPSLFLKELLGSIGYFKKQLFLFKEAYKTYLLSRMSENHEVVINIVEKLYYLIQRFTWTKITSIQTLPIDKPSDFQDPAKIQSLKEILSISYVGLAYDRFYTKSSQRLASYIFPCLYNELTPHPSNTFFRVPNGSHVLVLEKFIKSVDKKNAKATDAKEWGVVLKESNSACRTIFNQIQLELFDFNQSLFYIKSNPVNKIFTPNVMLIGIDTIGKEIHESQLPTYLVVRNTREILKALDSEFKNFITINVEPTQDMWTEIQKVMNDNFPGLFSEYNLFWRVIEHPKVNRLQFMLMRNPPLAITDYDTELGTGKRKTKRKNKRKKRRPH